MLTTDTADSRLLDHLRRHGAASVGELTDLLAVTATAVRQRLNRLMAEGLVERKLAESDKPNGRGRPGYRYELTDRGRRNAGDNYDDLVQVMWQEIRSIQDPDVRIGLVKRLAAKLADRYAREIDGEGLVERMRRLTQVMGEREVPIAIDETDGKPVLTILACPYPNLAEQDRAVCALEKMMLSELLGQGVRLDDHRFDGGTCCSFVPSEPVDSPSAS